MMQSIPIATPGMPRFKVAASSAGQCFGRGWIGECLIPVAAAALLIVPPALYHPLASFDEAWYASVARHVVQTGDWWNLRYNGEMFWDKPPLAIWATAAAYRLFGINELSTRIFAVASGLATVLAVFLWGRARGGTRIGWLYVLLLLCCHDWLRFCAKGQMDAPVTLFVALHVLWFWQGPPEAGMAPGLGNQSWARRRHQEPGRRVRHDRNRGVHSDCPRLPCFSSAGVLPVVGPRGLDRRAMVRATVRRARFEVRRGVLANERNAPAIRVPSRRLRRLLVLSPLSCDPSNRRLCGLVVQLAAFAGRRFTQTTRPDGRPGQPLHESGWTLLLWIWVAAVLAACIKIGAVHYWYLVPMYPAAALLIGGWIPTSIFWRRPAWTLALSGLLAVSQAVAYYLPPPREAELRATRRLARAVQSSTGPAEVVHLLLHPDNPQLQINIPAAHFYFDRIAEEIPDYENFVGLVALRGEITVVAHRSLLEELYGVGIDGPATPDGALASRAPVASRLLGECRGFVALRVRHQPVQVADRPTEQSSSLR